MKSKMTNRNVWVEMGLPFAIISGWTCPSLLKLFEDMVHGQAEWNLQYHQLFCFPLAETIEKPFSSCKLMLNNPVTVINMFYNKDLKTHYNLD